MIKMDNQIHIIFKLKFMKIFKKKNKNLVFNKINKTQKKKKKMKLKKKVIKIDVQQRLKKLIILE